MMGNGCQMLSLGIKPFSPKHFRTINRFIANLWWGWCVSSVKLMHDTQIVVSGDNVPQQENVIVILNHQEMADIVVMMFLAKEKGRLGDMKWFVKDVIKYVPGVGWGMLFLDCIFVRRDWTADKASIRNTFRRITQNQVPLWLLSFVEGTRLTPEKLKQSQDYARKKGLPQNRHVLVPRTKGFVSSVTGLRHHLDAVYDVTIGYPDGVPTLWQFAKGLVTQPHVHVRRFSMSELPESEADLATWLLERFKHKDDLLEQFYRFGSFGSASA